MYFLNTCSFVGTCKLFIFTVIHTVIFNTEFCDWMEVIKSAKMYNLCSDCSCIWNCQLERSFYFLHAVDLIYQSDCNHNAKFLMYIFESGFSANESTPAGWLQQLLLCLHGNYCTGRCATVCWRFCFPDVINERKRKQADALCEWSLVFVC